MTWQPGSVDRKPGHVRVGVSSIAAGSKRVYLGHVASSIHHAVVKGCVLRDFFYVPPVVYYVNGRREVYETDIRFPITAEDWVYFDPDGRFADNTPVLFRKLHKLEWLFG